MSKRFEQPDPPVRDFDKEQEAINQILNALAPFTPAVQATLIQTVVVFKGIYIPHIT